MYWATCESAKPTAARPLDTARLASSWVAKLSTLSTFLWCERQTLISFWASDCSVVPLSTETAWPHRLSSPLGWYELLAAT